MEGTRSVPVGDGCVSGTRVKGPISFPPPFLTCCPPVAGGPQRERLPSEGLRILCASQEKDGPLSCAMA